MDSDGSYNGEPSPQLADIFTSLLYSGLAPKDLFPLF